MFDREYYRLDQAADLSKCKVDDLIHFGATGKLPIYLLVEVGLCPTLIYETSFGTEGLVDLRFLEPSDPLFKEPIPGPLRLKSSCLKAYESRSDDVLADFDGVKYEGDSCTRMSLILMHDVYLRPDNMVVMADDLPLLTDGGVEKPIRANVERSMLQLIIGMAMARYGYDPAAKKNTAVAEIAKDLELLGIPLDQDTVRAYLQKAAPFLQRPNSP